MHAHLVAVVARMIRDLPSFFAVLILWQSVPEAQQAEATSGRSPSGCEVQMRRMWESIYTVR